MPLMKNGSIIDPVDAEVGGDDDIGGIAQTITSDDIDAILMSPSPVDERLEALRAMRSELEARSHADRGNDIAPLINQIDAAIALLSMRA
ncbi:MAG: hypothetical protein Q8S27_05965 [Hoeflea sp.]|uniref:hypothetical protein n=1 Tax=Hoeflea sp. TaxID=1940281 RepID=UPI0027305B88|nr:hypothetical protein [Hoeflea sp.]MDP2122410.1 hypothetical protein [Hoeflea sp.]MDP3524105.1 hypothetical protein [Hoeflea sp.]